MAEARFKINVQSGKFEPPVLTPEQMAGLAKALETGQKARWAKGLNAAGHSARPLAGVTAKGKLTYGKNPIRDMNMTGVVRATFRARVAPNMEIRAEPTSTTGRAHASKAQKFERMIGVSPEEKDELFAQCYRAYGVYLKRAWRPDRA